MSTQRGDVPDDLRELLALLVVNKSAQDRDQAKRRAVVMDEILDIGARTEVCDER